MKHDNMMIILATEITDKGSAFVNMIINSSILILGRILSIRHVILVVRALRPDKRWHACESERVAAPRPSSHNQPPTIAALLLLGFISN
jgi:hypothetical protein